MKLTLFYNPVAGRGKAKDVSKSIETELLRLGHYVILIPSQSGVDQPQLTDSLNDSEGMIVIGGDGSIRMAAPFAIETDVPVYQFPLGTENLFAREFGMDRNVQTLLTAINSFNIKTIDVGEVNGSIFLLMVSVGFDAEVVHDVVSNRTGAITHWTYIPPVMRQLIKWMPPNLKVSVDGEDLPISSPGMVVIGNSSQYAFRFDPAVKASMSDGLLDVVYFPVHSRLHMLNSIRHCKRGTHIDKKGVIYATGKSIIVESETNERYQIDGDAALSDSDDHDVIKQPLYTPLSIAVRSQTLKVITP